MVFTSHQPTAVAGLRVLDLNQYAADLLKFLGFQPSSTFVELRPWDIVNPLVFLMVVTLFPLGLGPDPDVLADLAPGGVWVVALLSGLLVGGRLFQSDFEDGTLEQLAWRPPWPCLSWPK